MVTDADPLLVVVSGRIGTGKTTLAQALARELHACYLRVDAIETAMRRAGVLPGLAGYAVLHELACSNLRLGLPVVVDAVNPVAEARAPWRDTAADVGAHLVLLETHLPDAAEHRRRVEARTPDLAGQVLPTWADVDAYEPWDEDHDGPRTVVDTTDRDLALAAALSRIRVGQRSW